MTLRDRSIGGELIAKRKHFAHSGPSLVAGATADNGYKVDKAEQNVDLKCADGDVDGLSAESVSIIVIDRRGDRCADILFRPGVPRT